MMGRVSIEVGEPDDEGRQNTFIHEESTDDKKDDNNGDDAA